MIQVFTFNNQDVRFVGTSDDPWWVAADVCAVLEIRNSRDAIARLDDDEKDDVAITDTIGRQQMMTTINESGLYSLVLTSRKPQAKAFKKWITSEVLPSIRKTGSYNAIAKTPAEMLLAMAQQMVDVERQQRELQQSVALVAENQKQLCDRVEMVEHEQDRFNSPCGHKYSVLGYALSVGLEISRHEASVLGKRAAAMCRSLGIELDSINDPRFGKVGLYPQSVLKSVFGEGL